MEHQIELFDEPRPGQAPQSADEFRDELANFEWNGRATSVQATSDKHNLPVLTNEFWTSKQRAASSLHEVSYRACFKPQLPAFFINRLTRAGGVVYDPFMGRGTTVLEAALLGRVPRGCDINPLSHVLTLPRLVPPTVADVAERLNQLDLRWMGELPEDLLAFYHQDTLRELCSLRHYLIERIQNNAADAVDRWIQMVAVNRLTGHSSGFFSVYTLPPNQAVSVKAQRKINTQRQQTPPKRDVRKLIISKSKQLLADVHTNVEGVLRAGGHAGEFRVGSASDVFWQNGSVDLVVTSPPFLDIVDYAGDNWLRCWFCGIDPKSVPISITKKLDDWKGFIAAVFVQLERLLKPEGYVAFEVGEVRSGKVHLEDAVVPCGLAVGLDPVALIVNSQTFTKTANIWGVKNNAKGTNTNRMVLFQKKS